MHWESSSQTVRLPRVGFLTLAPSIWTETWFRIAGLSLPDHPPKKIPCARAPYFSPYERSIFGGWFNSFNMSLFLLPDSCLFQHPVRNQCPWGLCSSYVSPPTHHPSISCYLVSSSLSITGWIRVLPISSFVSRSRSHHLKDDKGALMHLNCSISFVTPFQLFTLSVLFCILLLKIFPTLK